MRSFSGLTAGGRAAPSFYILSLTAGGIIAESPFLPGNLIKKSVCDACFVSASGKITAVLSRRPPATVRMSGDHSEM